MIQRLVRGGTQAILTIMEADNQVAVLLAPPEVKDTQIQVIGFGQHSQ